MKTLKLIVVVIFITFFTNIYSQKKKYLNGQINSHYMSHVPTHEIHPSFKCKSQGNNGKFVSYYTDGKLESKGSYINRDKTKEGVEYWGSEDVLYSLRTGEWVFYYGYDAVRGKLIAKGSFSDDVKTGIWEEYSSRMPQGNNESFVSWEMLKSRGSYNNGKKTGEWISSYEDGKLYSKCNYIDNKESGEYVSYYRNGQIMCKSTFINGKKTGRIQYNKDGSIVK